MAVHHARRIEEVPLGLRYDIRTRKTRLSTLQTLRELNRIRGRVDWTPEKDVA